MQWTNQHLTPESMTYLVYHEALLAAVELLADSEEERFVHNLGQSISALKAWHAAFPDTLPGVQSASSSDLTETDDGPVFIPAKLREQWVSRVGWMRLAGEKLLSCPVFRQYSERLQAYVTDSMIASCMEKLTSYEGDISHHTIASRMQIFALLAAVGIRLVQLKVRKEPSKPISTVPVQTGQTLTANDAVAMADAYWHKQFEPYDAEITEMIKTAAARGQYTILFNCTERMRALLPWIEEIYTARGYSYTFDGGYCRLRWHQRRCHVSCSR